MNNEKDITQMPYARWIENTLRDIMDFNINGIALAAIAETGETYISYYNMNMVDKLTIAGLIQQDSMMDSLKANGFISYEEDEENEDECEGEDVNE